MDSSVSQPSPSVTTRSASAFFSSIMSSIFSSTVPVQMNFRTCTFRSGRSGMPGRSPGSPPPGSTTGPGAQHDWLR